MNEILKIQWREEANSTLETKEEVLDLAADLYEKICDFKTEPIKRGVIEQGPHIDDGMYFYGVRLDNGEYSVLNKSLFSRDHEPIDIIPLETQVLIIGGTIIDIIPQILETRPEQVSMTKLVDWADIAGLDEQKENIKEIIEIPILYADKAKRFGIQPPKGIALFGPPGCGKTMIAKAIAKDILLETEVHPDAFIYVKGGEILEPLVGVAEQNIVKMFKRARKYMEDSGKQSIIFIDEADAILSKRGSGISSDVDKTIVNTFLSEMDGLDDYNPFILLATNRKDQLDDAVVRDGRIDLSIEIKRPNKESFNEILKIHLATKLCADPIEDLARSITSKVFDNTTGKSLPISGALAKNATDIAIRVALKRSVESPKSPEGISLVDISSTIVKLKNR